MASIMAEKNHPDKIKTNDLPQEITESYGTGVKDLPGYNIGGRSIKVERDEYTETSPELTGGDVDAYWQDADAVGDEAVGGSTSTPDQNVTEDLEAAVGLEMADSEFLHTNDILEDRDGDRWELDPKSSEDYQDRRE
ncbi:Enolase [Nostoc sp. DSM 114160]